MRNKLESDIVLQWLHSHDIVVLGEIKTAKLPHIPGFIPKISKSANSKRGGLAVLVKAYLYPDVYNIDDSVNEQLWFSLHSVPGIRFCGAYITPSSSTYFTETEIANLQAKSSDKSSRYVIVGDLNSRFGTKINELVSPRNQKARYNIIDHGENENGKKMINILKDNNLMVINNLKTESKEFTSSLTYRVRNRWISELDVCIVSDDLVATVSHFHVNSDLSFPSNHAPVSVNFEFPESALGLHELVCRSEDIGMYHVTKQTSLCKTPISFHQVDLTSFKENIESVPPPHRSGDPNVLAEDFSDRLYKVTKMSKSPYCRQDVYDPSESRWKRIMECEDDGLLWKAIDWKGQFDPTNTESSISPSETEFRDHLEKLLNPSIDSAPLDLSEYHTRIPVLDASIRIKEVTDVHEKNVKPDKSCGPDGNNPGVFKYLPETWISFICLLLNIVFVAGYPISWTSAKLIMLFKKGCRLDCNNYRGISIINAIAKIYDYVLNNRLLLWYQCCREQAGAQSKRGCIEHIVTLRLLIDVFIRKRMKLFIVFVDFKKAYDLVPRSRLFEILVNLGCGATMLAALMAMYKDTSCILGSTVISSTIGVRQGSPTSCYLFVIFVDVLILMFKSRCMPEPILQWLHCLMLMDDTIIFATSREKVEEKLKILGEYCKNNGMQVNESKTKFMAFNGTPLDKVSFMMSNIRVKHCESYVYLGVPFTSDGRCDSTLKLHLSNKTKELNKLLVFLAVNYDAPFTVKKKVLDAAFMSSILYGCESWLNVSLKPVETMYHSAIKVLLGVRFSTPTQLCVIEGGFQPLIGLVRSRQQKFFKKMASRPQLHNDPFVHAMTIVKELHKSMQKHIESIIEGGNFVKNELQKVKEKVSKATGTKFKTYLELNPGFIVHKLYGKDSPTIPDYLRINFSRYRLSSHRLRVEMGRWSKTPRNERVCSCGLGIQNEQHIFICPRVKDLFSALPDVCNSPQDLFTDTSIDKLSVLYQVLKELDDQTDF